MIELITIGSEILSGDTVNTNAAFIGKTLSNLGYEVSLETVVPDTLSSIKNTLQEAVNRSQLIIVTGGLGPTTDDCTKECAIALFSDPTSLPNSLGDAPGLLFQKDSSHIIFLPGVPHEMKEMFLTHVIPKLPNWLKPTFKTHTLTLLGLKEVDINEEFTHLQNNYQKIKIGIYPSLGYLTIRLKSSENLTPLIQEIEKKYTNHLLSGVSLDETLHKALIEKKLTLSIAESCTGGALSERFTAQAGASNYFLGGIISYSNDIKVEMLHVSPKTLESHGAVSEETALEMCTNVQKIMKSAISLAITGIAGPSGGTKTKPVGTVWIALKCGASKPKTWELSLHGNREMIIKESINTLLAKLFFELIK